MIQSMTGYGKSVASLQGKKIHVEIKSLNSKALDLSIRIAPLYRDAWFAIGDIRSETTLRGLLPDEERWVEIPAVPSADGSDVRIVSDCILPQQSIEFIADIKATGINEIKAEDPLPHFRRNNDQSIYDLQGRKHSSLPKGSPGVYIVNTDGRKVLTTSMH